MRFFLKFSLLLAIIIVATSSLLSASYKTAFPRDPGPVLDKQVRNNYLQYIEENHPQLVMIGDSTLGASIEAETLAQLTGKSVYSIGIPGSASALWYLVFKSNVAEASPPPEYVLIVFRDTILTAPGYRVHGSYFDLLDEYAEWNESLVIQRSFTNFMNPLEIQTEKYFPLYVFRADIRKEIDARIRYFTPPMFGCNEDCTDLALGEIFAGAELEPKALVDALGAAESYLYTPDQLDFETQIDRSYLPEIIRKAKEKNIKLIFVRVKVLGRPVTPQLDAYISALTDYLHQNDAILLDYGNDPRLTSDLYYDSIHISDTGRPVFTPMLADDLNKIFSGK